MKQKYISSFALYLFLNSVLLFADSFAYDDSSLDTSYEYVSNEPVSKSTETISILRQQLARQNERIDGLTSVIEGLSASITKLKRKSQNSSSASKKDDNILLLKELGIMIDKINDNYVSKKELQEALKGRSIASTKIVQKANSLEENTSGESLKLRPKSNLYREGVRLFSKKRYSEAEKRFLITDAKGYKPAASNYYLGEICYYTKKYKDAIFYFKKSAGLYDKATYMDTLLLHTAVSLEKSGDKDQAKVFYENVIADYSDKKSAQIAKKKLKSL